MPNLFSSIKKHTHHIKTNFIVWSQLKQFTTYLNNPDPLCIQYGTTDPKKTPHFIFQQKENSDAIVNIQKYLDKKFSFIFNTSQIKEKIKFSPVFQNSIDTFLKSNLRTPAHIALFNILLKENLLFPHHQIPHTKKHSYTALDAIANQKEYFDYSNHYFFSDCSKHYSAFWLEKIIQHQLFNPHQLQEYKNSFKTLKIEFLNTIYPVFTPDDTQESMSVKTSLSLLFMSKPNLTKVNLKKTLNHLLTSISPNTLNILKKYQYSSLFLNHTFFDTEQDYIFLNKLNQKNLFTHHTETSLPSPLLLLWKNIYATESIATLKNINLYIQKKRQLNNHFFVELSVLFIKKNLFKPEDLNFINNYLSSISSDDPLQIIKTTFENQLLLNQQQNTTCFKKQIL